eukprot:CAMPEP_0181311630 /NCGR_PEP_ID=MMETSP1101-20121128/13246_1 /TAXON_ID=46948 /ORGANISM="Rhodomonas abbreviata, Strain Caron Lab Isolate" /LENGTH=53 /DNA_ID=CAMNT_0023418387 /DNA_START=356 /DNA_END=514 /DNA_ORIENTATION=-
MHGAAAGAGRATVNQTVNRAAVDQTQGTVNQTVNREAVNQAQGAQGRRREGGG